MQNNLKSLVYERIGKIQVINDNLYFQKLSGRFKWQYIFHLYKHLIWHILLSLLIHLSRLLEAFLHFLFS